MPERNRGRRGRKAVEKHNPNAPDWKLRFEILEVYPGSKFEDIAISELYFDGIDVH